MVSAFFHHEEEGGFGGVDNIEFGGEDAASVVSGKQFFDHSAFYRAFIVTGINGDNEASVALQKFNGGLNGRDCGFVLGRNAFVTARKKA